MHITNNNDIKNPLISVVIVTYNSRQNLDDCLGSFSVQSYRRVELTVVDSGSTDDTVSYIRQQYPAVKIIASKENIGYRKGNALGISQAQGEYILVCNDDVKAAPDMLEKMLAAFAAHGSWGLVTPKILLFDEPEKINTAGNFLHFSGMYGLRGQGQPSQAFNQEEELANISGCCFMIKKNIITVIGEFGADFNAMEDIWHASLEDVDIAWQVQLLGYSVGYVPAAVLYHKYRPKKQTAAMFYSFETGRYLLLCRNYSGLTLLLAAPALLLLELLSWGFCLVKGWPWLNAKARSFFWLLTHVGRIFVMRNRIQTYRRVNDLQILLKMDPGFRIAHQVNGRTGKMIEWSVNGFFKSYYSAVVWIAKHVYKTQAHS